MNRRIPPQADLDRRTAGHREHTSKPDRFGSCPWRGDRGVVGMNAFAREEMAADDLVQRHQRCRRRAHPICSVETSSSMPSRAWTSLRRCSGRCRPYLDQNVCQQLGAGTAAGDRVGGRWRLADRFAASEGELLADVLDQFPLPRNELQRLGDVLADLAQTGFPAAGAERRDGIDDPFARQVCR